MRVLSPRIEPPETVELVDGQHGHRPAGGGQAPAEDVDERRLAHARGPADPHPGGATGVRHHLLEQGDGLLLVLRAGRLDQGDGPGQRPAVAGEDPVAEAAHPGTGAAAIRPTCRG
jgi:hypothetical protein